MAAAKKTASVVVNDTMQKRYRYERVAPVGRCFDPEFKPDLTPRQMLALGVFGGKYMTDCRKEFPVSWFKSAKLSPQRRDPGLNYFGIDASQPLSVWRSKGWVHPDDPRGWFQWYCRYYMGRRMPDEDRRGRSSAGRRSAVMLRRSSRIASPAIPTAGRASVRLCCIGPTTAARFSRL